MFKKSTYTYVNNYQFSPNQTLGILKRHLKIDERPYTFEELVEMTRSSPQIAIDMMQDKLEFTQLGEFQLSMKKNPQLYDLFIVLAGDLKPNTKYQLKFIFSKREEASLCLLFTNCDDRKKLHLTLVVY